MMRLRAVRALLVEEVAGLPRPETDHGVKTAGGASGSSPGEQSAEASGRDLEADRRDDLTSARRRAVTVAVLCATAVAVLFVTRDRGVPWLAVDQGEQGVFTVGILLVAAYAGFRLAQYLHLRTVTRLWEELGERSEE